MAFSQDWQTLRPIIVASYGEGVPREIDPRYIEADQAISSDRSRIADLNSQIESFQSQLSTAETELQKLKDTETAMAAAEAAVVVQPPAPALVVTPTPIIAPAPTTAVLAPEVRGQPGIAPTAEEVVAAVAPEVLLAGMPPWTWILIAGAAVFLLFGGEGISEERGKKSRRVRKGRK